MQSNACKQYGTGTSHGQKGKAITIGCEALLSLSNKFIVRCEKMKLWRLPGGKMNSPSMGAIPLFIQDVYNAPEMQREVTDRCCLCAVMPGISLISQPLLCRTLVFSPGMSRNHHPFFTQYYMHKRFII